VLKNLFSLFNKHYRKFLAAQLLIGNEKLINTFAKEQIRKDGNIENLRFKDISYSNILEEDLFSINILSGSLIGRFSRQMKEGDKVFYMYKLIDTQFKLNAEGRYISEIILLCNYCFFQRKYPSSIKLPEFEKKMKQLIQGKEILVSPNLIIYYKTLLLAKDPSFKNYIELKDLFNKIITTIHSDHASFIASTLVNYTTRQINKGNEDFFIELFNIYDLILRMKVRNEYVDSMVLNYTKAGCWAGKENEVKLFLEANQETISSNALNYCSSLVAYFQRDYKNSLKNLLDVEHTDFIYKVSSRSLVIQNFVMLEEFDVALNNIESLRVFLIRYKKLILSYLWIKTQCREVKIKMRH